MVDGAAVGLERALTNGDSICDTVRTSTLNCISTPSQIPAAVEPPPLRAASEGPPHGATRPKIVVRSSILPNVASQRRKSGFDPILPPGLQWYWKADFLRELSDEAIDLHAAYGAKMPTWQSTMHMYPINGAAAKVKNTATPWCYRDATWAQVTVGVDPDPANKERLINWARAYFDAVHPFSAGGAYINFIMDEGDDRIRAAYGKNYARLAKVKRRYDPRLFRVNQNIKPAK